MHPQVDLDLWGRYLQKIMPYLDLCRYFPTGHLYLRVQVVTGQVAGNSAGAKHSIGQILVYTPQKWYLTLYIHLNYITQLTNAVIQTQYNFQW